MYQPQTPTQLPLDFVLHCMMIDLRNNSNNNQNVSILALHWGIIHPHLPLISPLIISNDVTIFDNIIKLNVPALSFSRSLFEINANMLHLFQFEMMMTLLSTIMLTENLKWCYKCFFFFWIKYRLSWGFCCKGFQIQINHEHEVLPIHYKYSIIFMTTQ